MKMAKASEKEIEDFIDSIFEVLGCKKVDNPAIPTFLPKVIPKNQRWHPTK